MTHASDGNLNCQFGISNLIKLHFVQAYAEEWTAMRSQIVTASGAKGVNCVTHCDEFTNRCGFEVTNCDLKRQSQAAHRLSLSVSQQLFSRELHRWKKTPRLFFCDLKVLRRMVMTETVNSEVQHGHEVDQRAYL